MGLDMYLSKVKGTWTQEEIAERGHQRRQAYETSTEAGNQFDEENELDEIQLGYWRKHSDLHGYFKEQYQSLTPVEFQAESFNCEYLVLDREMIYEILDKTEAQLKGNRSFEVAEGFFWGASMEEDWKDTLDIFNTVLNTVNFEEETVLYSSWW